MRDSESTTTLWVTVKSGLNEAPTQAYFVE